MGRRFFVSADRRAASRLAFVGYPDDTSAIYHNPAGLMLFSGYRIELAGTGIYSGTRYQRYEGTYSPYNKDTRLTRAPSDATLSDAVKPDPPLGVLPFFGMSGDFGLENWRFGLGIYSPHNATGNFPEDGAQRFQVITGTIFTLFIMPTVAWQPIPQLSIGAQIGPTFAKIGYTRAQEVLAGDPALVDVQASAWSFAWGVGLLYRPIKQLSIGVSYSSQASFDFSGTCPPSRYPCINR
jgi:long-subunit fatty acid transport protein